MAQDGVAGLPARSLRKAKPAYQEVADQLRGLILAGELRAGDRLPSEADLVEEFGVSRSTVREALRALASRDLVHTRRGVTGGTFVSAVDAEQVSGYLETSFGLMSGRDGLGMPDMLEAREILEVPAAELAALRRTPEQVEALQAALEREASLEQEGESRRSGRFTEHRTFHQILVEAAGNPMLTMMTEPVFRVLQAQYLRPEVADDAHVEIDHDHQAIFVAVREGRADDAGRLMREHLTRLRDLYQG